MEEIYISVDVETAGPNPSQYSMLSIGACLVKDPEENFYVEIQPVQDDFRPEALAVSQLDMQQLKEEGKSPKEAMQRFASWVDQITPEGARAIFVAQNAPFDWMFVNDYFHRYLGHNPFGHSALDIKAFFMGRQGVKWRETGLDEISKTLKIGKALSHHALEDAIEQANLFRMLLNDKRG